MKRSQCLLSLAVLLVAGCASSAELPRPKVVPGRVMLPQDHQYQRVLRKYMATLSVKDFEHGVTADLTVQPSSQDPEYQYRNFLLTLMQQPLVGTKRGYPAVNAPARLFTLSSIEGPKAVMVPPVWPEALITFVQWDYPGNPYRNNRALKLRAFVTAGVKMMMVDDYLEKNPKVGRADWYSYQLVIAGSPYLGVKDLLPPEVQKAYASGVRKMARRIMDWGPKGEEPNLDMSAPVGLWYAAQVVNDPAFTKEVEAHARMMFTDPKYFHPAGYFVERGGLDVGFGGMANFFAIWAALASDWPFAGEAVERIYRLRAHLCLPEPDGTITGPTHFNSRLGSPANTDQWHWDGARDHSAAMITDEAACQIKMPSPERLAAAAARRAGAFNHQIKENPRVRENGKLRHIRSDEIRSHPWKWRMFPSWNFPAGVNPGYEFYRKGACAHRVKLEKTGSPYLESPFRRSGTFIRNFADAFTVAKMPSYGVILHTGPVGRQRGDDGLFQFTGPMGFGGGQLSAFWTPATGSVILGRRRGMHWEKTFDTVEEWRIWPIHAVSGCVPDGRAFTSARIVEPEVTSEIERNRGTIKVAGVIPSMQLAQGKLLKGRIEYARTFTIDHGKVRIETKIKADGKDKPAELYETLPIFLGEGPKQATAAATAIEFQVGGTWAPATEKYRDKVTAVRLTRFKGAVRITFDRPRRVKLSPRKWQDTYLTRAVCRNVMIDLLETGGKDSTIDGARVSYEIAATKK